MTYVPAPTLATYMRLSCRANLETIRNSPLTNCYHAAFASMARQRGLLDARAWLLGRLILDLHPHPTPNDLHASPHPPATHSQPAQPHTTPLHQHVESA